MNEDEAEFVCGDGTSFFLYQSQFAGANQGTAMSLRADDVDGTVAELRGRGVAFEDYGFGELKTVNGIFNVPDGRKPRLQEGRLVQGPRRQHHRHRLGVGPTPVPRPAPFAAF